MTDRICSIEECTRQIYCREYCSMHYKRWLRRNPEAARSYARQGCIVEGCEGEHSGLGYCQAHYMRIYHRGTTDSGLLKGADHPHWAGDDPTYYTAHKRLVAYRGRAKQHTCVDCGSQAHEWSYNHQDPNERTDIVQGYEVPYSVDITYYEPRCRPCHRALDFSRIEKAEAHEVR